MDEVRIKAGPDKKMEKIYFMRELTRRTGILNEAQVINLQTWPLVYTNAKKIECQFSYEDKLVAYEFIEVGPKLDQMQERYRHLEKSVKMLLGDEYMIRIFYKGGVIYPKEEQDGRQVGKTTRSDRKRKVSARKMAKKA